jgi:large subunit ribosomal protein L30
MAGHDLPDLTVTQVRSSIGTKPKHRGTLRALGLHGIGSSNTLPDRPEIRGMIARVPHLVRVDEGESAPQTASAGDEPAGDEPAGDEPAGKESA